MNINRKRTQFGKFLVFCFFAFTPFLASAQIYGGGPNFKKDCELSFFENRGLVNSIEKFEKNGKFGFRKKDGAVIIPPDFEIVASLRHGFIPVKRNGLWGFFNYKGKQLTDFIYDAPVMIDGHMVIVMKGQFYGLVDLCKREEVLPCKYEELEFTKENTVHIKHGGKYGLFDFDKNRLIEPLYDGKLYFNKKTGVARNLINDKWGLLDRTGKVLTEFKYIQITMPNENGDYPACLYFPSGCGLIDKTGKEIVPLEFVLVRSIKDTLYLGQKEYEFNNQLFNLKGGGFLSDQFEKVIYMNDSCLVGTRSGKQGLIDFTGKEFISVHYDAVYPVANRMIGVRLNQKEGIFDFKGQSLIPVSYDHINYNSEHNIFKLKKDGKYALTDRAFNIITDFEYDAIQFGDRSEFAIFRKNQLRGILALDGKVMVPAKYQSILWSGYDYFWTVNSKNNHGLIDKYGNVILPFVYQYVQQVHISDKLQLVTVKQNDKWGVVNTSNDIVVNFNYEELLFEKDYIRAAKEGKKGVLNMDGTVKIPFIFDYISSFYNGKARCSLEGKQGWVDEVGYFTTEK